MRSDTELLHLFHTDPEEGWKLFIDKYADVIFRQLRFLGFDYDQSMDRFVYICEKLSENNFHRLKSVRYTGEFGELTPWLRKVIKNLSINWAWSTEGRRRLLKSIGSLPAPAQRVFELYFWKGFSPLEIYHELQMPPSAPVSLNEVFEILEEIFSHLSQKKIWRLMCNLAKSQRTESLDEMDEERRPFWEPSDPRSNPEALLIQKEMDTRMAHALESLSASERLMIRLRYEDCMTLKAMADILDLTEYEVRTGLRRSMERLRKLIK